MANTETNTDNTDILTDDTEIDTIYGKVPLVVNGRKTAVLDADDVIAMVPKLPAIVAWSSGCCIGSA